MHPATYMNKILVISSQGSMQLWNVRKGALIHHFEGWNEPIHAVVQVNIEIFMRFKYFL